MFCYYPFATFLYSNLQFVNKTTDIKFHPQFIVYIAQIKFIFSTLASFLHSTSSLVIIRLMIMSGFMFILALISITKTPCMVQSVNHIFSVSYFNISYVRILLTHQLMLLTVLVVLEIDLFFVYYLMIFGTVLIWVLFAIPLCSKRVHI